MGQWPWPRAQMAKLVDALASAKVAAIGFDVLFSETDRAPSDAFAAGPVDGVDATSRRAATATQLSPERSPIDPSF